MPKDIRAEYGRLFGQHHEAKFFRPASTPKHEAKRQFNEWSAEVDGRILAVRSARDGTGTSLTPTQARAPLECRASSIRPPFAVPTCQHFSIPRARVQAGVLSPLPLHDRPVPIGRWHSENNGNKIGRITTDGLITEFPIPEARASQIGRITESNGNKIGRITTAGVITEFAVPTANSGPTGIAAGPDGALWFTEYKTNKIGRITTAGVITEFTIPTGNSGPFGITTGPDGALWFTESTVIISYEPSPVPGRNIIVETCR